MGVLQFCWPLPAAALCKSAAATIVHVFVAACSATWHSKMSVWVIMMREVGCRDRALLMVYPPPADDMALDALNAYQGNCVAVVGEWDGDTGTAPFTDVLYRNWSLQHAIKLPNWSDTAHDLTIWSRKAATAEAPGLDGSATTLAHATWPRCTDTGVRAAWSCMPTCKVPHCFHMCWQRRNRTGHLVTVSALPCAGQSVAEASRAGCTVRSCQYARDIVIASEEAAWSQHEHAIRKSLALRMIFMHRQLKPALPDFGRFMGDVA